MMKKIVFPGLVAGVAMLLAGMIVGGVFAWIIPSLAAAYQNAEIFRPWSDPVMSLYFLCPFVLALALAWVWNKTKTVFYYSTAWKGGVNFGVAYWVVSLSGMLISYSTFQLSLCMIVSWTTSGLVQAVCAGLIFSAMNKPSEK